MPSSTVPSLDARQDIGLLRALSNILSPEAVAALAGAVDRLRQNGMQAEEIADLIASTGSFDGSRVDMSSFGGASQVYDGANKQEFITALKEQSDANYNPKADSNYKPAQQRTSRLGIAAAGIAALVAAAGFASVANASPIMTVQDSTDGSGWFEYVVRNTTPGTDPDDRMINFTLPAGTSHGVYDAVAPTNWTFQINLNDTYFEGFLAPSGGMGVFELYSTDLNVHKDYATAMSVGNGAFSPVQVDVPGVPEPSTIAIMGLGLAGLLAKYRRKE